MLSSMLTLATMAWGARTGPSPRETVNFDFAWRHTRSPEPRYLRCSYEQNRNIGQGYIWQGPTASKEECCNECAIRDMCQAWDWNSAVCFVKDNAQGNRSSARHWTGVVPAPWPRGNYSRPPPRATPGYDDSGWAVVDAPHDMGRAAEMSCLGGGRRSRSRRDLGVHDNCSGWYRKHFHLPAAWKDGVTWVYFEGIYHNSMMWLNGNPLGYHKNGYTSFWRRLDTAGLGAKYGAAGPGDANANANVNVLTVFADGVPNSGSWYQGGGLTRHQWLVHTSALFLPPDLAWVAANVTDPDKIVSNGDTGSGTGAAGTAGTAGAASGTPADGLRATAGVVVTAQGVVANAGASAATSVVVSVEFSVVGSAEVLFSSPPARLSTIAAGANASFAVKVTPPAGMQLWSIARPFLYTARFVVRSGGGMGAASSSTRPGPGGPVADGPVVDEQTVTFGARSIRLSAKTGLWLNERPTKMRGMCDHSSFGGVGAAVPDRVHLFKAQALRSAGVNSWRMAHNPPQPVRLDVMDRVGMLALDENHFFGGYGMWDYGLYVPESTEQTHQDMIELVQRDRNHPAVWVWNFCNEVNCANEMAAIGMRNVTRQHDTTRPVTMNHMVGPAAMAALDISGMSHRAGTTMDKFHTANPGQPAFASEAVICFTERGVDTDFCPGGGGDRTSCPYGNSDITNCTGAFPSPSLGAQVNWSDARPFMAGTYVWTGFDYDSESHTAFDATNTGMTTDRVGFWKPIGFWTRSWWLSNISDADPSKPVLWPAAAAKIDPDYTLHIADRWESPPAGSAHRVRARTRIVNVYSNAAAVRLWVNGSPATQTAPIDRYGSARFVVEYEPGNLTAEALGAGGNRVATQTALTSGKAAAIVLSLDSPSAETGTGTTLVADGQDVAMVRATIVDRDGNLVSPQDPLANVTVTVSVVSGGGRILALHSGTPRNATDGAGPAYPASYGLLRAFVQSTEVRVGTAADRALLSLVSPDAGSDGTATIVAGGDDGDGHATAAAAAALDDIVVEASAPGMKPVRISIPLSADPAQLPLAVASATAAGA